MAILRWTAIILLSILVIVLLCVSIGSILFDRKVKREVVRMFAENRINKNNIVTEEDLLGLPEPVQRWLHNSKVIGKEKIASVRLKQKGFIRVGEEQPWMPFEAEQYYTTGVPEFIWHATVKSGPFFIKGVDRFQDGRGHMLIKLMSLIKVADARGPEIDQGTLVRYLNEIMWFPTAALNDYIEWEPIDSRSARAVMQYKGVNASAVFYFNEAGEQTNFVSERYKEKNGAFIKATWSTPITDYREFHDIRIPAKGEAVWELETGDFPYIKIELIDIDYNWDKEKSPFFQ